MTERVKPESTPTETIPGRPTIDQLLIGAGVLAVALLASVLAGPGAGLLVVTLGLLSAGLWMAYATSPHSTPGGLPPAVSSRASESTATTRARKRPRVPTISLSSLSIDRASVLSLSFVATVGSLLAIAVTGGFFFLVDRDINPPGFFADEAEIGVQSWKLLHGQAATTTIPFFYHHLEYNHLGTLSLFATAPFVALFGLTEHAVRGATVFWMIMAAMVVFVTLRRLRVPYAVVPVVVTMMSPLVILIARTNFGHAPSFMAMSFGFFLWVVARQQNRSRVAVLAGIMIGLSAYGQPSYYIGAPLLLLAIGSTEIIYNRLDWHSYRSLVGLGVGSVFIMLPIPYRALTYDPFLDRYRDKTADALHGFDRISNAIHLYPQYFSYDLLFVHGTLGWKTRHSIPGAPWLYSSMLVFLLVGLAALILVRDDRSKRFFWPMALVLLFYPIPDLVSRPAGDDPYSYSLVWGVIGIPFVVGYGLIGLRKLAQRLPLPRPSLLYASVMLILTLVSANGFWQGAFANYPNVAADYWGWQYGAKPIADYFKLHAADYDDFIMSGDFNAAYILEDFYMQGSAIERQTTTGSTDRLDLSRRQLFAMRTSAWEAVKGAQYAPLSYLTLVDTIYYPNGEPAFYLLTVDPALQQSAAPENQTPAG